MSNMSHNCKSLKTVASEAIDGAAKDLHAISDYLWNNPELAYKEFKAHDALSDFLEKYKFPVERNHVLETSFRAEFEFGEGAHAAVICEYDALPEIGHACGHNLIAEVGVGAAIGIKAAMEAAGKPMGKLTVLGTPAEEGGGGKIKLIDAGSFDNMDFAMMAHPAPITTVNEAAIVCRFTVNVTYRGKASHAAAFPHEGINALDAAVMAYNSISCLRQQMKPSWRVHGIISNGGAKPNIIPEETSLIYYARAPNMTEINTLKAKMECCFQSAAQATGCQVEVSWEEGGYRNMLSNATLSDLFCANAESLQVEFCKDKAWMAQLPFSTDMGNVSYVVPSIHPMFGIGSTTVNHTRPFTQATGSAVAQPYTLVQAKALAMTALDVMCKPQLLNDIKRHFQKDVDEQQK